MDMDNKKYGSDTYELGEWNELQQVGSSNPPSSRMDSSSRGILGVDSIRLAQCSRYQLDSRLRTKPTLCSTEMVKMVSEYWMSYDNSMVFKWTYLNWLTCFSVLNQLTELLGHFAWQTFGVIVVCRNPSVDFVQFQEDAWRIFVIAVVIFLCTLLEVLDVYVTNFAGWGWRCVLAVENVLTTARCKTRSFVHYTHNARWIF